MSFLIKNTTGAPVEINDLGITLEAGAGGAQTVNVGGTRIGTDATGLLNDATVYTASITVDGGTPQAINVTGSLAQTYTTLINEINADLTGATALLTGGNIVITSDTLGTGTISVTDTDLFGSLTDYVAILAAVGPAGARDMLFEDPSDTQASFREGDLNTLVTAGTIVVLDPKDGVTPLGVANALFVGSIHNDPNWGINGGILNDLDDVDTTGASPGDVLQLNGGGTSFTSVTPQTIAADIALGDLSNVTDGTTPTASDIFILKGTAGGEFTVADGVSDPVLLDHIQDTAGNQLAASTQTDLTITYNPATNALAASVDDNFLRNTGDVLDSGTLQIASGATLEVVSGGTITWADAPTNANDLTNKAYVDNLVSSGSTWRDPIVDPSLVDVVSSNPATPETTYSITTGEHVTFIATAAFTFSYGTGATVAAVAGDIVNLSITSAGNGDYSLIEPGLAAGDRFIIAGEEGTIGSGLSSLDPEGNGNLANADLIEFTGTGDGSTNASWIMPEGRSGQATHTGTEIQQGVTVLCSDPDSVHYGHTYLYDADNNVWIEIAGPGSIQAGDGLSYSGTTLNVNFGAGITQLPADEVGVDLFNTTTGAIILTDNGTTRATTTSSQLHLLLDGTTLTQGAAGLKVDAQGITETELNTSVAGLGIAGGGGTPLSLDPSELTDTATVGADVLVLGDASAAEAPIKRSVTNFIADHDIVANVGANGIIVQTAADTYTARTIVASTVAGDQGISVVNGDGILGNPEIGVDVVGLAASGDDMVATDLFLMYDGSNNVKVSGQQIADGVSTILGGLGNAYTTINGDTGSATAATTADTLSLVGATNGGITTVAAEGTPDSVTFALDIGDLILGTGPLTLADEIAVLDGTSNLRFTLADVVEDLNIPYNLTADGFIVRTADDTYTSRSIEVQGVGAEDGLAILNGDGVTGNPIIGLDIDNNAAAGENLVAGDKILAYNLSGVANETFTGQEVADGVADMLGFGGLTVASIPASVGTQDVLVLLDSVRAKSLSVGDTSVNWSENKVKNNDWLNIGGAVDATSGYIVPLQATIVKVTGHTAETNGNTQTIELYINGTASGTIATFGPAAGEDTYEDVTTNIDLAAGDKIRLRGGTGGDIDDTVVTLWIKWRAT